MIFNVVLNIFVFFCWLTKQVHGQDECVPRPVRDLQIFSNGTLSWLPDLDETCEITTFKVNIVGGEDDEYDFNVTHNYIDLSFMEVCEQYKFTVVAISNGVVGFGHTLISYIPVPRNADLYIRDISASATEGTTAVLKWEMSDYSLRTCTLQYRIIVIDEQLQTIHDFYVDGDVREQPVILSSPCVSHFFELWAINRAHPTIEGPRRVTGIRLPAIPQTAPRLDPMELVIHPTSINMTWTLQGVSNRCQLKAFYIDAGSVFNISVTLDNQVDSVPVQLTSLRSNTMYYMKVYVENVGGVSLAAPIAIQTLSLTSN